MRFYLIVLSFVLIGHQLLAQNATPDYALILHGGAGYITRDNVSKEKEADVRQVLEEALLKGEEVLKSGGSAIDAVERVIMLLEDSPHFNAGKGAVFTHEGTNEMDASIMEGKTLNAGAIAGVKTIRNPISTARAVMEKSPHVMLSGRGAEEFAEEMGEVIVDPKYFEVEEKRKRMMEMKEKEKRRNAKGHLDLEYGDDKFGTVGVVALDENGNLAAGTSTGGMSNKRWGRIGDSPIIGAGTYANNSTCAVSCTGSGEYFIRTVAAHRVSDLVELKGLDVNEAANQVLNAEIKPLGGEGGMIVMDAKGNMAFVYNTPGMYRGQIKKGEKPKVMLFGDEE